MKTIVFFIAAALLSQAEFAASVGEPHTWTITIRVTDETGIPVPNARVGVGYYGSNSVPASIEGTTDTNGMFMASHNDVTTFLGHDMGLTVEKPDYYRTRVQYNPGPGYDPDKWNLSTNLVLKKIANPIAMYARWVGSAPAVFKKTGPPPIAFTNAAGYDLIAGDWVVPYGKGVHTDIIFTEEFNKKSFTKYFYRLTVHFPNKGDGIQEFFPTSIDKSSELLSPHEAPKDGYQPELVEAQTHDPNRNFFFRVQTVLDRNGNVKNALYGKIYGDFMHFRYYLNPTPNDHNVEFDPRRNLLKGLKPFEEVRQP